MPIDQQREENVRDRVIHSRRLFEEQTVPVGEKSFSQNFLEAIFAGNETREGTENKTLEKQIYDPAPNMAVVPMAVTSENDLTFVKTLPKERKVSFRMSIFDRLMTKQEDSTKENDAKPSNGRPVNDISEEDGQGVTENRQQKSEEYNQGHKLNFGLDNQGFDTKETQFNQHSQDVSQDEGKAVPSVASDIESAQPPTFVKTLSKEQKVSFRMSIFDRLMTKQEDSTKENDAKPSNGRPVNDISEEDGQGVMENGQQKSEVYNQVHKLNSGQDNQGFDTKETQLNQHSQDVCQDEGKAVPSVTSDIESAQPPKPKSARTWLKDPHLYKVT